MEKKQRKNNERGNLCYAINNANLNAVKTYLSSEDRQKILTDDFALDLALSGANKIPGFIRGSLFEKKYHNKNEIAKELLNVYPPKQYYLLKTIQSGVIDIVELLLNLGLSPNGTSDSMEELGMRSMTPWQMADAYGKRDVAFLLIKRGADIPVLDNNKWQTLKKMFSGENNISKRTRLEKLVSNLPNINLSQTSMIFILAAAYADFDLFENFYKIEKYMSNYESSRISAIKEIFPNVQKIARSLFEKELDPDFQEKILQALFDTLILKGSKESKEKEIDTLDTLLNDIEKHGT